MLLEGNIVDGGIVGLSPIEQCKNAIGWGQSVLRNMEAHSFQKWRQNLSGVLKN